MVSRAKRYLNYLSYLYRKFSQKKVREREREEESTTVSSSSSLKELIKKKKNTKMETAIIYKNIQAFSHFSENTQWFHWPQPSANISVSQSVGVKLYDPSKHIPSKDPSSLYLSHCCMMEISLMISCRSDSTGTCLIATIWPVSLWIALYTLP